MKKTLLYLTLVLVILSLSVFGAGAAPQDAAAEGNIDSPIYTIYCDYDGPDAVMTPCGSMPASHVHFVDNGSVIKLAPEGNYIYTPEGKLTEFVPEKQETPDWLHRVEITKRESVTPSTITAEGGVVWQTGGWIESAYTDTQSNLAACEARWMVPGEPPVAGGQAMGLFVGIQGIENNTGWILQPVLQWGVSVAGGDPNDWTGVAFCMDGDDAWFASVIDCNVGDIILGAVAYNEYGGIGWHQVLFRNETTDEDSYLWFWGGYPTSNCQGVVTLEGYNFDGDQHVPFNTLFKDVKFLRRDLSQIKWPTMYRYTEDYDVLTNLGVDAFFSGFWWWTKMNVRLRTDNGGPDW